MAHLHAEPLGVGEQNGVESVALDLISIGAELDHPGLEPAKENVHGSGFAPQRNVPPLL